MSSTKTKLQATPLTPNLYEQWARAAVSHQYPRAPIYARRSVVLVDGDGEFVAAVGLHETDGPLMLAEDFVTNPALPTSIRADAVQYVIELAKAVAVTAQKVLVCTVANERLAHWLLGNGLVQVPGIVMAMPPGPIPVTPMRPVLSKKKAEETPTPSEDAPSATTDHEDSLPKNKVSRKKKGKA